MFNSSVANHVMRLQALPPTILCLTRVIERSTSGVGVVPLDHSSYLSSGAIQLA